MMLEGGTTLSLITPPPLIALCLCAKNLQYKVWLSFVWNEQKTQTKQSYMETVVLFCLSCRSE